jgi:hypothetical protein
VQKNAQRLDDGIEVADGRDQIDRLLAHGRRP